MRVTREFELATHDRSQLIVTANYQLNPDGTHARLLKCSTAEDEVEKTGNTLRTAIQELLGRSLVDPPGGCRLLQRMRDWRLSRLNNPIHDIERFGIHFVASPRHADMLLVTGPVTRNMELALRQDVWRDALAEARGRSGSLRHQRRNFRRKLRLPGRS